MKILMGLFITAGLIVVGVSAYSNSSDLNTVTETGAQPATQAVASDNHASGDAVTNPEQSAVSETKWVTHYGDYYVNCYVTGGVRWYTAINESNLNDALVNQTPSDEVWAEMCGGH